MALHGHLPCAGVCWATRHRHRNPHRIVEIHRHLDDGGENFKTFWSAYPKKAGKDAAKKAFAKRKFDEQAFEKVMAALNEQKASEQWVKDAGQFIPHPATWLNQGRFDDELMGGGQQASSAFSGAI